MAIFQSVPGIVLTDQKLPNILDNSMVFSLQNHPKDLDSSHKTESRSLGRVQFCIIATFHKTHLVIRSHSREGKTPSKCQISVNTAARKYLEMQL